MIPNRVKVVCFDRLLQVFILKDLLRAKIGKNRMSFGNANSTGYNGFGGGRGLKYSIPYF